MPIPGYWIAWRNWRVSIGVRNFIGALILVVLGVILATQAYVLLRPHPPGLAGEALVVRDPNGNIRASLGADGGKVRLDLWDPQGHRRATLGLGAEGSPHLAFYDRDQRVRAELNLGPDGEPQFTLRDKRSLQGKTAPNDFSDSSHRPHRGGAGLRLRGRHRGQPPGRPGRSRFPQPGR